MDMWRWKLNSWPLSWQNRPLSSVVFCATNAPENQLIFVTNFSILVTDYWTEDHDELSLLINYKWKRKRLGLQAVGKIIFTKTLCPIEVHEKFCIRLFHSYYRSWFFKFKFRTKKLMQTKANSSWERRRSAVPLYRHKCQHADTV